MDDPKGVNDILISPEQMRAARGLLDWSQQELAEAAGLSVPTVKRAERDLGLPVSADARTALQRAFEAAGIVFIDENGGGVGVRLRKKPSRDVS